MKIPGNELEDLHPEGVWRARIKSCGASMDQGGSYDVKVLFSTKVGTLQQSWNTKRLSWKIKILRDALGLGSGDFDTDLAIGKEVDIEIKNVRGDKRTFQNVEVHAAGTKTDEPVGNSDGPPTVARVPGDVPF